MLLGDLTLPGQATKAPGEIRRPQQLPTIYRDPKVLSRSTQLPFETPQIRSKSMSEGNPIGAASLEAARKIAGKSVEEH